MIEMSGLKISNDKRYRKPFDKKRQLIIKSAAKLFIEKGFVNTSTRDIAAASGMTVGTLYHYVESKDAILSLFVDAQVSYLDSYIAKISMSRLNNNPVKSLKDGIKSYLNAVHEIQDIVLFWYQETRYLRPEQREYLLGIEKKIAEMFIKVISAGCNSGEFKVRDIGLAAHSIIVLGDMWAFRRWYLQDHCSLNQYIREQTRFILRALCDGKF